MSDGEKPNQVKVTKCFPLIAIMWLLASVALGWCFDLWYKPPSILLSLYENYHPHINDYELFCGVMMFAFALAPLAFLFMLKFGFSVVLLRRGGGPLFLFLAFLGAWSGFGGITPDGGGKISSLVIGIVQGLDWIGGVLVLFWLGLYILVVGLAVFIKNNKEAGND